MNENVWFVTDVVVKCWCCNWACFLWRFTNMIMIILSCDDVLVSVMNAKIDGVWEDRLKPVDNWRVWHEAYRSWAGDGSSVLHRRSSQSKAGTGHIPLFIRFFTLCPSELFPSAVATGMGYYFQACYVVVLWICRWVCHQNGPITSLHCMFRAGQIISWLICGHLLCEG